MKLLPFLGILLLLVGIPLPSEACTAFALRASENLYIGKNLDWSIASGYVFVNDKDVQKCLLRNPDLTWRSRFRSLSFHQLGKEFPLAGMNEAGLVVEELNMQPVDRIMDSAKLGINEFQVVQFMLDNCASIDQVKEALRGFQLCPLFQSLHYFIADRFGKVLIAEFDGSKFQYYTPAQPLHAVLSNNKYTESNRYLQNFQGFGGQDPILHRKGSCERFVSAHAMLQSYKLQPPVEYAFGMLDTLGQSDTRWSLVYDVGRRKVHFRFHGCTEAKVFDLKALFERKSLWGLGGDLAACSLQSSRDLYPVSAEENASSIRAVLHQMWKLYNRDKDTPLLYAMAMLGDSHLPHKLPEEVLEQLNRRIRPLPELSPLHFSNQVFDELAPWGKCEIVGLGEATHGTREFCQLKHRIFRYLVEEHNFRVLAYEYSFRKSIAINQYVMHGKGDLDSLLSGESWIQNNEEVKDLLRWMRDYNRDKVYHDKIRYIGVDTQLDAMRLQEVLSHLENEHQAFCRAHPLLLDKIKELEKIDYASISSAEYIRRTALYQDLASAVLNYSGPDHEVLTLIVSSLLSSHDFLYSIFVLKENPRDRQLADNVLHICSLLANKQKVVVWAHNAHVGYNPDYYGPGEGSMGKFLKDTLQDLYLTIGTAFSQGGFKAVMIDPSGADTPPLDCIIRAKPPGVSTNYLLHNAAYQRFVLDLNSSAQANHLYRYLSRERPLMGIGDCYLGSPELHFSQDRILNLSKAFDLLFYFDQTHPITLSEHEE